MGNVRLYGSTSGYTELAPPAIAPDGVLTLPSGTGTLATAAYVDAAGPTCRVYRTSALSHATSGSYIDFSWDTESYDTNSMWEIGTPTRIIMPKVGIYQVTGTVSFSGNATGIRAARIKKNGVVAGYGNSVPGSAVVNYLNISAVIQSTVVTDYIELDAYQDSTASLGYYVGDAALNLTVAWIGSI